MQIADQLLALIARHPGKTEAELARMIFGKDGYQQQVNQDCRLLIDRGLIRRSGKGGGRDPFTYTLAGA